MKRKSGTRLGGTVALALGLGATSAGAHGGIPRVAGIHFEPGNPGHSVLSMELFGLLSRRAEGEPYRFVCAEAFGGNSMTPRRTPVAILADGTQAIAVNFQGLRISRDGGCNFEEHPAFADVIVSHVATSPDGRTLYVTTSVGRTLPDGGSAFDGGLHRSDDGGRTFAPMGSPFPSSFAPRTFAVAPSRPGTVYVAGGVIDGGTALLASDDGGGTWVMHPAPAGPDGSFDLLVTVSPSRPDEVVLAYDHFRMGSENVPETIWISRDGGALFTPLFQGSNDVAGLAFSPDGSHLAIGGSDDGLWTVVLGQSVLSPTQVSTRRTWGLAWTPAGLFMGLDAFGPTADPNRGDIIAVSMDDGATMTTTVSLCDVRPPACRPTDGARALCGDVMSHVFDDFFAAVCTPAEKDPWYGIIGSRPSGGGVRPGGDAGTPNSAAGDDDLRIESGCAVRGSRNASGPFALLGLFVAAAALRGRRSRLRPWSEPPAR